MKKLFSFIVLALCTTIIFGGCSNPAPTESVAPSNDAVREEISEWPDNTYTNAIIEPEAGTPDYVISDKQAGYYAIFLNDITMEQGKQYINKLKENGFTEVAGDSDDVAVGQLLQKDNVDLSISVSDDILGIYIKLSNDNT